MLIYSLITRGTFVLAEYTAHDGDFPQIARKLLVKSEKTPIKKAYIKENYLFTLFTEGDFTFMVMTDSQISRKKIHEYLDCLANLFYIKYSNEKNNNPAHLTQIIKNLMVN